jgi:hypothetical protein
MKLRILDPANVDLSRDLPANQRPLRQRSLQAQRNGLKKLIAEPKSER